MNAYKIDHKTTFNKTSFYGSIYRFEYVVDENPLIFKPKTSIERVIINSNGYFECFPGIYQTNCWTDKVEVNREYEEGFVRYWVEICPNNIIGGYDCFWLIQPDGSFWMDETGYGAENDVEIILKATLNNKGEFISVFSLYSLGGIKNQYNTVLLNCRKDKIKMEQVEILNKSKEEIWIETLRLIRNEMPDISFQTWFYDAGLIPVDMDNKMFYLFMPESEDSELIIAIILNRYMELLTKCISESAGRQLSVVITSDLLSVPGMKNGDCRYLNDLTLEEYKSIVQKKLDAVLTLDSQNNLLMDNTEKVFLEKIVKKLLVERDWYSQLIVYQANHDDEDHSSQSFYEGVFDGLSKALSLISDYRG